MSTIRTGTKLDISVGDWVRFYQNGRMVIGVVSYFITRKSWEEYDTICTDVGATTADAALEVR